MRDPMEPPLFAKIVAVAALVVLIFSLGADFARVESARADTPVHGNYGPAWCATPLTTVDAPPTARELFVAEWAPRIEGYLEGSPLAGHGATFAEAAYDNGIDPRLSPAISCIESSKGRHCFASHNAWGWYGQSFGDWDSAINAHAAYLAEVYWGGEFSERMARKYCELWESWYFNVRSEMGRI